LITGFDEVGALFNGKDSTTDGSWIGVYGSQAYNVINATNRVAYPLYAAVDPGGNLFSAPKSPVAATASPATIISEQAIMRHKTNKKGKPVGTPVFLGVAVDYSTATDPSTAGLGADSQVDSAVTQRVKRSRRGFVMMGVDR
jgi:hypothetical protein